MSLVLKVDAVWKSYDEYPILKGCSFFLDRPGIYILKGPNGSGKSTLLRLCALLEEPDKGEIAYYSKAGVVRRDRTLRRRMTLVLPGGGIFNTSVVQNVAYGLRIRGVGRAEREMKVERALRRFGLGHKKSQNALTLSSGESRRLTLARAMVLDPGVLFLDEPTAYVDDESREMIEETILALREEGRRLVFIATHDVTRVESVAEKVLVIREGKVVDCSA